MTCFQRTFDRGKSHESRGPRKEREREKLLPTGWRRKKAENESEIRRNVLFAKSG